MIESKLEELLRGGLDKHIDSGKIAIDPNFALWKSGVYSVIDCVFSAQARYEAVVLPMLRERMPARPGMADSADLRFTDFVEDVRSFGVQEWDAYGEAVLNLQVLAGRRKVEVCFDIAQFFIERGLETSGDLAALGEDDLLKMILGPLQSSIHGIGPSLARYLAILLGVENQIKPDIMIMRFFGGISDWSPRNGNKEDIELIESVIRSSASKMGTTAARLDNAIWLFMSNGGQA